MSQSRSLHPPEPWKDTIDLESHGFTLGIRTPRRVAVDLVRTGRAFALDVGTESTGYHVIFRSSSRSESLEPVRAYRGSTLIASNDSERIPGIDGVSEWLQFVIEYATESMERQ